MCNPKGRIINACKPITLPSSCRTLVPQRCPSPQPAKALRRCKHGNAPVLSATAKGTQFEIECITSLHHAYAGAMQLHRRGGKGDKGLDFVGWWHIKDGETPATVLRVVGQCKALASPIGPVHIREFGAVLGNAQRSSQHQVVGILCAQHGFTSGAYSTMRAATASLLLYKPEARRRGGFALLGNKHAFDLPIHRTTAGAQCVDREACKAD